MGKLYHVWTYKVILKDGYKTHELEFVIVKGKKASLVGIKASTLLGLAKRVHKVNNMLMYFKGLENL